ncbi:hypothetical protein OXX59_009807, partial [Metschnikowia pulcherrima]
MLRLSIRAHRRASLVPQMAQGLSRRNHTAVRDAVHEQAQSNEVLTQKLREKVLAEALAKEEEAMLRAKALRELKEQTRQDLHTLNVMPSDALEDRLQSLQSQLDSLPDQDKVKQLDEEIEDFLFQAMRLPQSEIGHA